jgi:Lsr2 protein
MWRDRPAAPAAPGRWPWRCWPGGSAGAPKLIFWLVSPRERGIDLAVQCTQLRVIQSCRQDQGGDLRHDRRLDGSPAEGTVRFGLDGVEYVIDLNTEHAQALRDALARYVSAARRAGAGPERPVRGGRKAPASGLKHHRGS